MSLPISPAAQQPLYAAPALSSQASNHSENVMKEKPDKTPYLSSLGRNLYDAIAYTDPVTNEFALSTPEKLLKKLVGNWDDESRSPKENQISRLRANEIVRSFDQNGNHKIDGAQTFKNRRAHHGVSELTEPGSELEKLYEYLTSNPKRDSMTIGKTENTPYLSSLDNLHHKIGYTDPLTKKHHVTTINNLIKARVGDWDDVNRSPEDRAASLRDADQLVKSHDRNGNQTIDGAKTPRTLKAFHGVGEMAESGSEFEELLGSLLPLHSTLSA
ncbi:hypothetical protein BLL37_28740 [Pseudomonas azotoformans]|uniref:Uncharacterized protein n=1 Tax=Pseudomonas azotoformans TaxID=47878 RepID=A0A1V2J541_PSEAZ|nr:hypothetical protein [Pseudomonas azotoformans]OIN45077.1 hypothetical protein BFL39_25210 [Pseudomonas azotoformans]ONH40543.1 hypothetical protein BLL37_28740 [Pseudomonas azotoformans]SDP06068.1 hypothetical protein SAMN04489799_6226 [Pseudomonas azotoformans]